MARHNRIPNGTPARANRQAPTRHTRPDTKQQGWQPLFGRTAAGFMGLNPQCLWMRTAPPPASELLGVPHTSSQERIRDNHATTSAKKTLRALKRLCGGPKQKANVAQGKIHQERKKRPRPLPPLLACSSLPSQPPPITSFASAVCRAPAQPLPTGIHTYLLVHSARGEDTSKYTYVYLP
jgi:hypothetical protein